MELSINVGYFGPHISDDHDLIKKLDDMGFSCIGPLKLMVTMQLHHSHIFLH